MKIPWYNVSKCDEEKSRTQKNPRERGLRLRASYYRSVWRPPPSGCKTVRLDTVIIHKEVLEIRTSGVEPRVYKVTRPLQQIICCRGFLF